METGYYMSREPENSLTGLREWKREGRTKVLKMANERVTFA